MPASRRDAHKALDLTRRKGVIRLREAQAVGIHPEVLRRLVAAGSLVRVARGMYATADRDPTEYVDLARAAARVPHGVICLLSALHYHGIGTQLPHEVWMMIHRRTHHPKVDHPPMRFILGSGRPLTEGVDKVKLEGVTVKIFNPAKTVADCFRYRRHVGLEVAIEALRSVSRDRRCTPDDLWRYAKICRIASVMRPYLEAVT